VRYLGEQGEVSQVFHLTQSVALGGGNFVGVYNVAVTPKEKVAQICDLVAWTSARYVNLLDRQVWVWPVDDPLFAYDETTQSRVLMWGGLAAGFLLPFFSYFLWKKEE
jgi:hypothetical protein